MEFRILGPLEVLEGGRMLEINGQKPRALLAVLLLHANRVVTQDMLVDALWEADPPESAQKALQVYVSQLRKTLGGSRIATRAGGYRLRVDPGELDVERFEELLGRGGESLREALSLWRGPPLADFAYDQFARAESSRLEEMRVGALEERCAADLEVGRHADLIPELNALVELHPFRERLRSLLMLALYRSGRQAEALEAYRDARRALVEELGIEPTSGLRELEAAILRQDPMLDLAQPSRAAAEDVPPASSYELSAEPSPAARERKLATVLFAELVASADSGEEDPERAGALLERFHAAMADEIERAGGTVEWRRGDAILAAFGVPAAQEDHAERALHAALAMRARCRDAVGGARALRVGVSTGNVVADASSEEGVVAAGDALNAAAHLGQAAAPGQILVGERTVAAVSGAFEFSHGPASAALSLVRATTLSRPRGVGGLHRAFVGRQTELELMAAAYERAVRGHELYLVTIMGDAGIGKTSLVAAFRDWLRGQPQEPLTRTGRCLAYGRGITYWPLGEVLKEHFGLLESDPPELVRERLGDRQILGLTLGFDAPGDLHPLLARERLHEAWVELLDEIASIRPAVIVVEDLHWAEEQLLDLLEHLLRSVSRPLLLLTTARPELLDRRSTWAAEHHNATRLWLERLPREDAVRMLEELLGPGLPSRVGRLVLDWAEGNPFFLEELISALIDRGFLARRDGGWELRQLPEGFAIPDSIESILAARLDLLGRREKAALQAASVVGRVFWRGPVLELAAETDVDWGVLVGRDFIRRRRASSIAGEEEFAFKHALTRDVAYESVPKGKRAHLHAVLADWLERRGAERDEYAPLLAHHYAEAVKPEDLDLAWPDEDAEVERLRSKALLWLRRSADLAAGRYAVDEQINLLERAFALEPSAAARVGLQREITHAHAVSYNDEGFRQAVRKGIELSAEPVELAEFLADAAFQSAVRWQYASDQEQIEEWSRRSLDLAGANDRVRAKALVALAIADPEKAATAAEAAEAIAAELNDPLLRSWALYLRTDVALAAGAYEEAVEIVEQQLEVLPRVDDPDHRANFYWAALPAYLAGGRADEARKIADLHDAETAGLTPHHRLHGVAVLLEVEQLAGGWERIRALTPRMLRAVEQNTTRCMHNRLAPLTCALAAAYLGDEEEARRLEVRSEESGVALYGRAESAIWLALHRHDLAGAETLLEELERPSKSLLRSWKLAPIAARLDALAALGRRGALEHDAVPLLRPGTYLEPFARRALGVVRQDEALVEEAARQFATMGFAWHAARTRAQLAASNTP